MTDAANARYRIAYVAGGMFYFMRNERVISLSSVMTQTIHMTLVVVGERNFKQLVV